MGTDTWTCDRVDWTGDRCRVALNCDGHYRDLTLPSVDAIAAFVAATQADLQAGYDAEVEQREADEEFAEFVGEEL